MNIPPATGPEAPRPGEEAQPPPPASSLEQYSPLTGPANWTQYLLVALAVVDVLAVVSGLFERSLLGRAPNVTESEASANDTRQAIVGFVQTALYIATAVLFIIWFHRAYRNLTVLGAAAPRYRRGWAIGGWFVPFVNFWRPKQVANDIWRASEPTAPPAQGRAWEQRPLPRLYALWWGAWIVSILLANRAFRLSLSAEELDELRALNIAYLISDGFDVLAAVLAVAVVRRTTQRQQRRAEAIGLVPGRGIPAPATPP